MKPPVSGSIRFGATSPPLCVTGSCSRRGGGVLPFCCMLDSIYDNALLGERTGDRGSNHWPCNAPQSGMRGGVHPLLRFRFRRHKFVDMYFERHFSRFCRGLESSSPKRASRTTAVRRRLRCHPPARRPSHPMGHGHHVPGAVPAVGTSSIVKPFFLHNRNM